MELMYCVAGAFTGFVVGLTGVGGGALMTPILLLFFGVAPITAVATDLWFATITKIAALLIHHNERQVEWPIVYRLWLGSLPAAFIVPIVLFTGLFQFNHSKFITVIIGSVILITALGLLSKNWLLSNKIKIGEPTKQKLNRIQQPLTIFAGVVLGVMVSLTSVGAGALGAVILFYLYPTRLTPNKIVGTDIAHAIPLALIAGLGYLIAGHVDTHLLFSLLIGSIPAAILGAVIATRFGHGQLQICLVVILSFSGLKLIF